MPSASRVSEEASRSTEAIAEQRSSWNQCLRMHYTTYERKEKKKKGGGGIR